MGADRIRIENLRVEAIIGILPQERLAPQPVDLTVELSLDATIAALSGDLTHSLDYAALAQEVCFIVKAGRFRLLETAALALVHHVLTPVKDLQVSKARVTLRKPLALGAQPGSGVPAVIVERSQEQVCVTKENLEGGSLVRIFASREVNLWRLEGAPNLAADAAGFSLTADFRLDERVVLRVLASP